jgi:hypothetical protein
VQDPVVSVDAFVQDTGVPSGKEDPRLVKVKWVDPSVLTTPPKPKEPSPRERRRMEEEADVERHIRRAIQSGMVAAIDLEEMKPATYRLRFKAAKSRVGDSASDINLVVRAGEFYLGPIKPSRRGGRRARGR